MILEPRVEVCFLATSPRIFLFHLVRTFWGVAGWRLSRTVIKLKIKGKKHKIIGEMKNIWQPSLASLPL